MQPVAYRCIGLTAVSRMLEQHHAALLRAPTTGQPVRWPYQPRWMPPPSPGMCQMHITTYNTWQRRTVLVQMAVCDENIIPAWQSPGERVRSSTSARAMCLSYCIRSAL